MPSQPERETESDDSSERYRPKRDDTKKGTHESEPEENKPEEAKIGGEERYWGVFAGFGYHMSLVYPISIRLSMEGGSILRVRDYAFMRNSFSKEAFFFACVRPSVCRKTLLPRTKAYFSNA
jgi:hypothetical protein